MSRISNQYKLTVTDRNDPLVDKVRTLAKVLNSARKLDELMGVTQPMVYGDGQKNVRRYRVRIRGRLGKNSPHRHLYAVGGPLHRDSAQDIRPEHASRFDVYVQQYWQVIK